MRSSEEHEPEQDHAGGQLLVVTRSGSWYHIDLDAMLLKRIPADHDQLLNADTSTPIRIINLGRLALGERLELVLEPLGDPRVVVVTRRLTTEVVSIIAVEPHHEES